METTRKNIPCSSYYPLVPPKPKQLFSSGNFPINTNERKHEKSLKQQKEGAERDLERNKFRNKKGYKFIKELWKFNEMIETAVSKKSNVDSYQSEAKFLYEKAKRKGIPDEQLPSYVVVFGAAEPNAKPNHYMHKRQNYNHVSITKPTKDLPCWNSNTKFNIEHNMDFSIGELETFPRGYVEGGH